MTSTLAVIPARGGSKRVPRKNIRILGGRPAIAYTIDAALRSSLFDRVVVSTDDEEVASIARQHGAEVPFVRPPALADDITPVSLVTLHALEQLDPVSKQYACVAQLMPNCPLRTVRDVENSYRQFIESNADAQISVTRFGWLNPWWAVTLDDHRKVAPVFKEQMSIRSQDLPDVFCPTGAIWWAKSEVLRQLKTFYAAGCTGWEIAWQRAVDIDTEEDWQLAELLMQARKEGRG